MLATQCLDQRIPDTDTLIRNLTAWETQRNNAQTHNVHRHRSIVHPYPGIPVNFNARARRYRSR